MQWSAQNSEPHSNIGPNGAFIRAATELVEELHFSKLSDLGHLFDSVLCTNTISTNHKRSLFSHDQPNSRRSSSTASWLLSNRASKELITETPHKIKKQRNRNSNQCRSSLISTPEDATVIDIFNHASTDSSATRNLTVRDSNSEDRHIFLVKKIESNKDLVNLLSIGFRFAEPVFISKTMGEKLQVPSEYMLSHFRDMLQMVETASTMYAPLKPSGYSFYASDSQKKQDNQVRGGVFVGVFSLIDDNDVPNEVPFIIVDKQKRYAFPMVQLVVESSTEQKPTELSRQQKNIILGLSGQSLANIATMNPLNDQAYQTNDVNADESLSDISKMVSSQSSTLLDVNASLASESANATDSTQQFIKALQYAAKSLINLSSYGKPLASSAKLYGDVLDVPAFSLRSGPCQLILFRAHVTTPGTRFAINQTLTESIKCVPFPMYRSFAYYSTDLAVEKYRMEQNKHNSPSSYLTQQRLYQSTASRSNIKPNEIDNTINAQLEDNLEEGDEGNEDDELHSMPKYIPAPKGEYPPMVNPAQQQMSSLPPPPRVKRNKFTFPTGIASLDVSNFAKDLLPSMSKGNAQIPLTKVSSSGSSETLINLNLLPTNGRFWWLDIMYDETHNSL
jgi:hypothetical protein